MTSSTFFVLNFKVGEGTIADGKQVWTSVLADAMEQEIGVNFKGQLHRHTLRFEKFTLKCSPHGASYTAVVKRSAIIKGVEIEFQFDRPKDLCPCGEWKLIKFLYCD